MDINIYIITDEQRNLLINCNCDKIVFNPIQDVNNNYFLNSETVEGIRLEENLPSALNFILTLESSVYEPTTNNLINWSH
jgi:hypothetical protein